MIRIYRQSNGNVILADPDTGAITGTLTTDGTFTEGHQGGTYDMGEAVEMILVPRSDVEGLERVLSDVLAYAIYREPPHVVTQLQIVRTMLAQPLTTK